MSPNADPVAGADFLRFTAINLGCRTRDESCTKRPTSHTLLSTCLFIPCAKGSRKGVFTGLGTTGGSGLEDWLTLAPLAQLASLHLGVMTLRLGRKFWKEVRERTIRASLRLSLPKMIRDAVVDFSPYVLSAVKEHRSLPEIPWYFGHSPKVPHD